MQQTILDLWHGNLHPCAQCGEGNGEIQHLLDLMRQNRDVLDGELSPANRKTLEKYSGCWDEYTYLIAEQAFCQGFRLAAGLLTEALAER